MATRQYKLRGLALVIGCASLLPIACSGDDDSGNPTPPGSGGSGARGGTAGKGGSGAKGGGAGVGEEGGATTGGSSTTGGTGGKGGSSATGGKGGSGAKGGSGGTGAEAGTSAEGGSGNIGGSEAGSGGTGPQQHDCTEDDLSTFNCGTTAHPVNIECYADCNPTQTDDGTQFLNRCPDGSGTLGGVKSACSPWTATLTKLGAGCKALGTGCSLPALP